MTTEVALGSVCEFIRGVTFDKDVARDYPIDNALPILRAGNIQDELNIDTDLIWVPQTLVSREQHLRANDIVICMSSGSPEVVGKTARVISNLDMSVGSFCGIIRPRDMQQATFLSFFFQSPSFKEHRDTIARGANIQNLRFSEIEEIPIRIPEDYAQIASKLSKAERLQRMSRFTSQMCDEFVPAAFLEMFGDPTINPKGMPTITIGASLKLKSGDAMTSVNMGAGGRFPVYGGNGISGYHTSFAFQDRQIVIGRVGVYCGVVHYTQPQCWISDNALYISDKDPRFLDLFLVHLLKQLNLNQYADRSGQPLVSQGRLEKVSLLLPPLPLQQKFTALIEHHERMRSVSFEATRQADHLLQTLLHQAFTV